jgi:hypothetical protein
MHREAVLRTEAKRPLVVGDRMDTDIEGAQRAGADSLLVLTGVTNPDEVVCAAVNHRPTYIGEDLRALLAAPGEVEIRAGATEHGAWAANVDRGRISIEQTGEDPARMDALRALCGAAWSVVEPPGGVAEALAKAGW